MKRNPFDRGMFESQATGSKDTTFVMILIGAFVLVGLIYIIRSTIRKRTGSLDLDAAPDTDLTAGKRGFFGSMVTMVAKKKSARDMALSRLVEFDPPSINCTILKRADGTDANEDVGRALLFHHNGEMFIQDKAFYISMPDGVKAEDRALFTGQGEVINIWFLHDRIPYTVNCDVADRIRFPPEMLKDMDPKIGAGYRLVKNGSPRSNVAKRDKRQAIRFSHKIGRGSMRVYPQILFDASIQKTDFRFPTEGSIPPRITSLKVTPYGKQKEKDPEGLVKSERTVAAFKEAVRMNHSEDRVVYVSKPYMDERTNKRSLIDLGFSEVLGLGAQETGRTIHLKKPLKSMKTKRNRKDPNHLGEGDTLVLHYFSRSPTDGQNEYFEMICVVVKGGIENVTVRPQKEPVQEVNLPIELLDFSLQGLRFENSKEFHAYVFGNEDKANTLEEQQEILENTGFLITFHPRLRFNRDTESYKPDLPLKFEIIGKIVRTEVERDEENGEGRMLAFGVRYMYDPAEYSMDDFCFDRWLMIRSFKENSYFKEVHNTLNGLIAHLESQAKEIQEPRRPVAQEPEKAPVA